MQSEFVPGFGPRSPAEAVELLTVEANDVAQIAVPPENGTEDFVEFRELHLIGFYGRRNADVAPPGEVGSRPPAVAWSNPVQLRECIDHQSHVLECPPSMLQFAQAAEQGA